MYKLKAQKWDGVHKKRIKNKIIYKKLDQISPLGIPLVLEINRQTINKSDVNEYFLEELESEMLDEVGLNWKS